MSDPEAPITYRGPHRRVSTPDGRVVFPRGESVEVPEPLRSRLLEQATFTEVEVKGTGRSTAAEAKRAGRALSEANARVRRALEDDR